MITLSSEFRDRPSDRSSKHRSPTDCDWEIHPPTTSGHRYRPGNVANTAFWMLKLAQISRFYCLTMGSVINLFRKSPVLLSNPFPYAPWCWYTYLHDWVIYGVNAGVHIPAPWFAYGIAILHFPSFSIIFPAM